MVKPEDVGFVKGFDWGLYPAVEKFLLDETNNFLGHHDIAKSLADRMINGTSTRFFDWIDHMILPEARISDKLLTKLEFQEIESKELPENMRLFRHPKTEFFPLLITNKAVTEVALKPEELDHFLQGVGKDIEIDGDCFAPFRKALIKKEGNYVLAAVERRAYNGYVVKNSNDAVEYIQALSRFFCRQRVFDDDGEGMKSTERLVGKTVRKLKKERVSDAFFRSERAYWQRKNRAGQIQKARQERLGLGWGNHDHHTYRSSRENFTALIKVFEKMGYLCREKFYAGEAAKWGAQIMEHPVCDIVVFADVDLFPEETELDFTHSGLVHREELGTVGLWVGLHGESMLQAGMHHLEARFDFERLRADLPNFGIGVMKPFSYFDFLKQAFTAGERWQVEKSRLDKLMKDGSITKLQYDEFLSKGAVGSHMENLQRNQGFKGFNQRSVTAIIKATDPRSYKIDSA